MANVDILEVEKHYGSFHALKSINLEIEDGEFIVLVGPSGCGKSTLLRSIAGLENISDGEIFIGGKPVTDLPPKDRDIAMVFQNYALYPHKTVYENMAFSLRMRRVSRAEIEKSVRRAAEILHLEDYLDRYPAELSGGQRQRVAMGRALVRSPSVFLFDEPLSNLDAKLRVSMRSEIKSLHQRLKTTSVYVTHDQTEAMTMADRIVIMQAGIVEQIGTPAELYGRPENIFVAQFIGSPPMNLIEAEPVRQDGGVALRTNDGFCLPQPSDTRAVPDGDKVVWGVRPEHVEVAPSETENDALSLPFDIELVEPMGAETVISGRIGQTSLTISLRDLQVFRPGQRIRIRPRPDQVHLFQCSDGVRIS